jgi:hypothetical protein
MADLDENMVLFVLPQRVKLPRSTCQTCREKRHPLWPHIVEGPSFGVATSFAEKRQALVYSSWGNQDPGTCLSDGWHPSDGSAH